MAKRLLLVVLLLLQASLPVRASESDPLEVINRPIFVFNDTLDRFLLRPVARGYDFILPQPAQNGVGNFLSNIIDVNRSVNALLQGRLQQAGRSAGRVVINSTLGMFGLFDVATHLGVEKDNTDFGETLAVWGLPEGPYLVVPLFGPRTVRSGTGTLVDVLGSVPFYLESEYRWGLLGLNFVDTRARLLESDQLITGDRYIFIRDAYLQSRRAMINDGEVVDDFSDFEDDWEDDL
jgi:phospholipid-binding lipoprotein MlaA